MSKSPDLCEVPDPPRELLEAGWAGDLVLFVGAGMSRLLNLPSWAGMAAYGLEFLRLRGAINYSEKEQLSRLDARKQLSIATQIAREEGLAIDFKSLLTSQAASPGIYDHINDIGCVCVTTNYDELLAPRFFEAVDGADGASLSAKPVVRVSDRSKFLPKLLEEPGTVVHLHGAISAPATMVVTTRDYLAHYDEPMVQEFLGELFAKKTVLFLGYGLEEAEILEHVLRRGNVEKTDNRRRFALQGYFRSDEPLYRRLCLYYESSFGVHVVGFERDRNDFAQQEFILKSWASAITVNRPTLMADFAAADEVLKNE